VQTPLRSPTGTSAADDDGVMVIRGVTNSAAAKDHGSDADDDNAR